MITDYEDDTHFCIKCHSTILGLDNYVTHRKNGCAKNVEEPPKSPLPSQLLPPDESFSLKADDFFSSLELQSSSKKPITPTTSGSKNYSGILTRSKTTAVIQASSVVKDHFQVDVQQSKSGKNAWIGGHQLKELGSGDNQAKLIKAVDNLSRNSIKKYEPQQLSIYEESDENSEDFDYDDESDEDDSNEVPPRNYTGGKWKPTSPVQWTRNDKDWHIPPPQHTGGKWKPTSVKVNQQTPPPNHTRGKWKPSSPHTVTKDNYDTVPPPTFTGSKWSQSKALSRSDYLETSKSNCHDTTNRPKVKANCPPPEYTKGKWKPQTIKEKESFSLPANYTKGKWKPEASPERDKWGTCSADSHNNTSSVKWDLKSKNDDNNRNYGILDGEEPPFRKSSGTVQYWCRPCNRRLASKIVYERHLKSELHFKRTLNDKEFDDSSYLNISFTKENKRPKRKFVKLWASTKAKIEIAKITKRRNRKKLFVKCEVCRSKVNSKLMGKHLISHYHCRKGDIKLPEAKKMVLDNIHSIVLQAPYQCAQCKFYCNTQQYFLFHWKSDEHKNRDKNTEGLYLCTFCKFSSSDTDVMLDHLNSEEHNEVIAVINKSVPIVIRKIKHLQCKDCDKKYFFNVQLKKHCDKTNHTFDTDYQNRNVCSCCEAVFASKISLQRHRQNAHGESYFICSVCNLNFKDKLEAKLHRRTAEHRYVVLSKNVSDTTRCLKRTCDYCPEIFENLILLKRHLKEKHPQYSSSCPYCGKTFVIPQDLTVHLRKKSCLIEGNVSNKHRCNLCRFTTNSESEFLFHKILHTEPLVIYDDGSKEASTKRAVQQYKCSICDKFFTKASLRCHLRLHTKERPYKCVYCSASFVRKNNWVFHVKKQHKECDRIVKGNKKGFGDLQGERPFLCSTCGASFKRKSVLHQHMTRHSGKQFKCSYSDCVYTARTLAELKPHMLTHSDAKPYSCELCDYKGKTKQQLQRHKTVHEEKKKYQCPKCPFEARLSSHIKRHMRLHTGAKPFACPHCDYRCNNLENLRKHVLSTNKHPGKCLYECKFCSNGVEGNSFGTNFAKEFKVHLVTVHSETFESGIEAATYVAGIYEAQVDPVILYKDAVNIEYDDCNNPGELLDRVKMPVNNLQVDPIVAESAHIPSNPINNAILFASIPKQNSVIENKNLDELFPTFVISKDIVCIENPSDSWNIIESNYDVDESGCLVPFSNDGETFFQNSFE